MTLAIWCMALAAGIAVAVELSAAAAIALGTAALLGGGVIFLFRRRWAVAGTAAMFVLGALAGLRASRVSELPAALAAAAAGDHASEIVATVARAPEQTTSGARLVVRTEAVDGRPVASTLAVSVMTGWPDLGPGERVRLVGRVREVRGLANPELPDSARPLRAAGIDALAAVADAAEIERLGMGGAGPRWVAFRARRALRAVIVRDVAGVPADLLRTAVIGDRRGVGERIEAGFRAAGATHVLSVSGLHLAVVALVVFAGLSRALAAVPGVALRADPRAIAAAAALPAIAFYTLLTGEAVATVRSAVMVGIGFAALLVGRAVSAPAAIGAAGLALLLASPLTLFDVSFQLSITSVAGLALLASGLAPAARGRGAPHPWWSKPVRWAGRMAAASLAATAATAPLVAHHFGEVAPAGILGNLLLVPPIELVVVPFGLAGAALGSLWAPLGAVPLFVAAKAAAFALAVAEGFRRVAPVWAVRMPNLLETGALMLAGCAGLGAFAARATVRRALLVAAGLGLCVAVVSLVAREVVRRRSTELRVTVLDVGQGDSILVETPGGRVVLVDGGGNVEGTFDPGERVVEPILRRRGIGRLELVILSHPHPDHMNGLRRILERFEVGTFWTTGDRRNPELDGLVQLARARGVRLPTPAPLSIGGVGFQPLGPFLGGVIAPPPGLGVNDASLVVRATYAGRAVLLPGDVEESGEGELAGGAEAGWPVRADLLKVPHHGSRTSSTAELLDAVRPSLAVMSLGWRNRFGFPHPEVLARYAERGIPVLRTDRDGAVSVTMNREGVISVRCARLCAVPPFGPGPRSPQPAWRLPGSGREDPVPGGVGIWAVPDPIGGGARLR